jgi:hypothetical protein
LQIYGHIISSGFVPVILFGTASNCLHIETTDGRSSMFYCPKVTSLLSHLHSIGESNLILNKTDVDMFTDLHKFNNLEC